LIINQANIKVVARREYIADGAVSARTGVAFAFEAGK
jgi:hypothetical protein